MTALADRHRAVPIASIIVLSDGGGPESHGHGGV